MNELKPEDVMKALGCCASGVTKYQNCETCPLCHTRDCMTNLFKAALDLLREKDAEIERLKQENKDLHDNTEVIIEMVSIARAEAITEFVERIKEEVNGNQFSSYRGTEVRKVIDRIAKEMKGDEDGKG